MRKLLIFIMALMMPALLLGASNGVIAAEQKSQPTGGEMKQPAPGEKTIKLDKSMRGNMCSQTKMRLLDQIRTAEGCAEKANKEGRVNDAKNCWNAFPRNTHVMSDRARAEVIPESECPPIGPGGGSVGLRISCYHADYLVWCCGGGMCCDSAYGGYGCWSQ